VIAPIRVVIADDHPIFRRGLRDVIESEPDLEVVAEAENGGLALERILTLKPDIALLDAHMPVMSGLEIARAIRAAQLDTSVVFLTMYKDEQMFDAAMDTGVEGYVLKESAVNEIADCIRAVASGQPFITPLLSAYVLKRRDTITQATSELDALTPAEKRVLRLVAEYKTSKEIANELGIHYRTVDNHRTNVALKLGLQGSHAVLRFALQHRSALL
jgi:DNA-binding NarL/FixJ family response regulator